ncbi:MAG: aldo/keto reductase [Chloroflexota bacterium]|nr:aldo/keto reductase [Chloroflexota bacterium]
MHTRTLGRSGLRVSALCLGTNTFGWTADEAESHRILDAATDAGITFIDTADVYSRWAPGHVGGESEMVIGRWLAGRDRSRIVLATKVRAPMGADPAANDEGLSRIHIVRACEDSLRRLHTDHIDLYQAHWDDDLTPLDETLEAFTALIQAGKVRYIGVSNTASWRLLKARWISSVNHLAPYISLQPHYSLVHRVEYEREMMAACTDQGIGVIPYSPLAVGFLTGKYTRDNRTPDTARGNDSKLVQRLLSSDQAFAVLDETRTIAEARRVPVAHVALAWTMTRPNITAPIVGARTVAQLQEVVGAVDLALTADEIARLTTVSEEM